MMAVKQWKLNTQDTLVTNDGSEAMETQHTGHTADKQWQWSKGNSINRTHCRQIMTMKQWKLNMQDTLVTNDGSEARNTQHARHTGDR